MARIVFFEKPGCVNNARQKALLRAAGHTVNARNLLTHHWKAAELRAFFSNRPVVEWFNSSAPRIKSGEILPGRLNEGDALTLMIADPLLIRRPLMHSGGQRMSGFDPVLVDAWVGLGEGGKRRHRAEDMESCPRRHSASSCETP